MRSGTGVVRATGIDALDSETWERWWHHLLKTGYSVATKKKRILYARSLIRWMASKGAIPLPSNLNERRYGFKDSHPAVAMPDLKEIRRIVGAATGQLRLHMLLMLNCALTQIDVANLRQDEVDWEHGRIKRKRTKTKSKKAVPVVNYPLWSETWALLKQFREPSGDLVLRTHSGKAWVRDEDRLRREETQDGPDQDQLRAPAAKAGCEAVALEAPQSRGVSARG